MSRQKISLIVTVKDDADSLSDLRQDVSEQTRFPDEVILTVADSSDASLSEAESWSKAEKRVRVIPVGPANRSQGRNLGIKAARGEILVFTDAGCRLQPDWVAEITAPFNDPDTELVSGVAVGDPRNDWEAAQVPFVLVHPADLPAHPLPATRAMAVRKSTFERVGGFQERLEWGAEDYEWSRRAVSLGVVPVLAEKAKVYWRPRPTRSAYWKMIHALTMGDVQAETWRWGHASMLGRYGFFAGMAVLSLPTALGLWGTYIGVKSWLLSRKAGTLWWPTVQAHVLTDLAVSTGLLRGVLLRPKRRRSSF